MSNDPQVPSGALNRRTGPETFRARAITVALTVDDIRASLAWYKDVLAFHVDETYEEEGELRGAALLAGIARIVISQDDGAEGRDRRKGEGFSIHLATEEDVDEVARKVRERGGELQSEPADMPWGVRLFRVRDPDGFTLAISSESDRTE